jgi:hypothetical protein
MKILLLHPDVSGRKTMISLLNPKVPITYISDDPLVYPPTSILCESSCGRGFVLNDVSMNNEWSVIACESVLCLNERVTDTVFQVFHAGLSNRQKRYLNSRMEHAKIYEVDIIKPTADGI